MSRVRGDIIINENNLASVITHDLILDGYPRLAIQSKFDDVTPSGKSFADTDVDIVNDKILVTNHGLSTGTKGRFTTTGTLPSGLSLATDYWIIYFNVNNFKVANSYANAIAGIPVDLNSIGSGTHTFTASALNGGTLKGQASNDGISFVDLPSLYARVDGSGTAIFNVVEPAYRHLRIIYTPSSGVINLVSVLNAHDDLVGMPALSA
jgi:hypothetical protein